MAQHLFMDSPDKDFLCQTVHTKKRENMAHGHDVLHMMEGNSYATKEELVKAIIEHFGKDERFHTCSVENMDAAELVDFLTARGKFMPAEDGFTVDASKICNH